MSPISLPPTSVRVERNTNPEINDRIRALGDAEVLRLEAADDAELASRLEALEHEWDVERALQVNASVLVMAGVFLGARVDRRFLALPAAVFTFFLQHALQGWCPPLPVMRRMGIRTQREIERERYALKALRGDFDLPADGAAPVARRVRDVLRAVDA
jgi:hypothetical protein